ncbi:hypothetical protein [Absidia glauca]|uniref:RNase H type-1 domain-containing protein n=1 Tax=Absidia glauca TaxID=4829 RepID=A0A168Q5M7_ABSGL|nr:hypothetical protein [Absidia glauca]
MIATMGMLLDLITTTVLLRRLRLQAIQHNTNHPNTTIQDTQPVDLKAGARKHHIPRPPLGAPPHDEARLIVNDLALHQQLHPDHANQDLTTRGKVKAWTGHSYKRVGAHFVIGIGIQFDDRTNLSLQVAILSKTGAPSNHAELMAIVLILAVLKWKNMEDYEVTINSNQPSIVTLINNHEKPSPDGWKQGNISKFVCDCVDEWPQPVFLSLGVKKGDLSAMKAAKSRAVSVRKQMEDRPRGLTLIPGCLWDTTYGHSLSSFLHLPDPKHRDSSFKDVLQRSTVASTLASIPVVEYRGSDAQPTWKKEPPSSSSSSQSKPTTSAAPPNWPSGIPYPIPFELAGKLISQLISITAPPTPEEMERLTPQATPVPMPPPTPQQQHMQPTYYATQAPYIPSAPPPPPPPPPVPLYHQHNQPTPPLPPYMAGSSYQPYHSGPPYYPVPPQQLPMRSPIYPSGSDPAILSPGPQPSESTPPTLLDPRLDPRLHSAESVLASVPSSSVTPPPLPPPPPSAPTTATYAPPAMHPARIGLINTFQPTLNGGQEQIQQQYQQQQQDQQLQQQQYQQQQQQQQQDQQQQQQDQQQHQGQQQNQQQPIITQQQTPPQTQAFSMHSTQPQ